MSKCSYDRIFYRVFCGTLLVIACTFTVILTNVFVDIDTLLAKKGMPEDRITVVTEPAPRYQNPESNDAVFQQEFTGEKSNGARYVTDVEEDIKDNNEVYQPDENQELESSGLKPEEDDFRTKRSIDASGMKFHLKNPKIKEILNNRLSTLLEELDAEGMTADGPDQKKLEPISIEEVSSIKNDSEPKKADEGALHKALHDILLQGILERTEVNEVYSQVLDAVRTHEKLKLEQMSRRSEDENKARSLYLEKLKSTSAEEKFMKELSKCTELHKEIDSAIHGLGFARRSGSNSLEPLKAPPKILIKTIIDIKTLNKNDKQNDSKIHANNIKGLIKLIYNGQAINFSKMEDDEVKNRNTTTEIKIERREYIPRTKMDVALDESGNIVDEILEKAVAQYLKKYPMLDSKFRNRRSKRSSKSHKHSSRGFTEGHKKKKKDEGELYVEIETHFDSQGIKGEKKKKLVKAIIEKIRKALRDNLNVPQNISKNTELLHIKKRTQNPLKITQEDMLVNKMGLPFDAIVIRKSDPISKSVKLNEPLPNVLDNKGKIWQKPYGGSNFLSNLKSINSGEMGLVNLDYDRVAQDNGIPQRLQQPLNTDNIEPATDANFYNLGDLKFYIKEIEGTGFSIGFNQYVGDVPDPDSINSFTGLQQLLSVYNPDSDDRNETSPGTNSDHADDHEVSKRDTSKFSSLMNRLPLSDLSNADYHSNEYKVVFDEKYLPYDSYAEIFEDGNKTVTFSLEKDNNKHDLSDRNDAYQDYKTDPVPLVIEGNSDNYSPLYIDKDLFNKALKPSEIFGIANLLNRKKRSPIVKVKQYTNLGMKTHINRLINTKRKSKRLLKNNSNKRNKRQIDKIRIIATDGMPHMTKHSDENYYVVSDENIFADRALIREVDIPEQDQAEQEDTNEYLIPMSRKHVSPFNVFASRSRQNSLMSKYPHLFLEEITRSKEEDPMFYSKLIDSYSDFQKNNEATSTPEALSTFEAIPMLDAVEPPSPSQQLQQLDNTYDISELKPNYKLTVKIVPKNQNETATGFKSVHTSINKTITRNGVLFLSQMNVSELSKVENLNKPDNQNEYKISSQINFKDDSIKNFTGQTSIKKYPEGKLLEHTTPKFAPHVASGTFPLVKHIKEQQETMKNLLKQHKQRIDEQLDTLKKEKQNIDSMIVKGLEDTPATPAATTTKTPPAKKGEIIDVLLPLNPPQMLHLNREEARQLISNALMKLHNTPLLNDISPRNPKNLSTTTPATTTRTTTSPNTQSTVKRAVDPEKLKLLRTIQRNENITNAILYKIDRNTNLLQHFLQQLTEKLVTTAKPVAEKPKYVPEKRSNSKDWASMSPPFFPQPIPNMEFNKNMSHVSIPFVYAYQQPYPPHSPNSPVASVIYQGHIHTNAFNNGFKKNMPLKREKVVTEKREINNTKFFLDELESGYKVNLVPLRKEAYSIPRVKNNLTLEYLHPE